MKRLNLILSLVFLSLGFQSFAQTDKQTTIKIVTDRHYTFVANTATPMANNDINRILATMPGSQAGSSINLTGSQYDVKVTKDSIVAYLPYFGRSFSAPMDPTQGGIKFNSKNFTYKESKNKKGMYTIQIETKDVIRENYRFTLNISANGYASLTASSINKQPIIFNGYLEEPKKKD